MAGKLSAAFLLPKFLITGKLYANLSLISFERNDVVRTTMKVLLAALVSVCVTVTVMLLLWNALTNKPLLPDRPPDQVDENAVMEDDGNGKMNPPDGGGGLSLEYIKEITIDLTEKTASLYFKNSGESLENAVLMLVIQDTVILQSDLLPPGSSLTTMPLPEKGIPLQKGNYDGAFVVQFFHDNGEVSQVNSRIEGIQVKVK